MDDMLKEFAKQAGFSVRDGDDGPDTYEWDEGIAP